MVGKMTEKRFTLIKDTEWWFVQDNTIQVNEYGYRDDLTGEDKYRGLQQDLTEQETVDLLNEFNYENNQLYIKLKEQEEKISKLSEEVLKLKVENGNLKIENKRAINVVDRYIKSIEDDFIDVGFFGESLGTLKCVKEDLLRL